MAATFSLTQEVHVFPCPNCRETINTSMQQCAFCAAPIDALAAQESAAATTRISQACSDASYLRILAWSLLSFFAVLFIPVLGLIGFAGLWFLRFAIPVMVIRWWIKFGSIKTTDPDFSRARFSAIIVSVVAALALASIVLR